MDNLSFSFPPRRQTAALLFLQQTPFTETQKHAAEREYISFPDAVVELELFLFGFCVKSWAQNFRFDEKNVCNYHLVTFLIKVI